MNIRYTLIREILRTQELCLSVGVVFYALLSVLGLPTHLWSVELYALCLGNITVPIMRFAHKFYAGLRFPVNWLAFLALLTLAGLVGATVAAQIIYRSFFGGVASHGAEVLGDIKVATLVTVIAGTLSYAYSTAKAKLERRNAELNQEIEAGTLRWQEREADLAAAREIQAGLIPRKIPQIPGLEIEGLWRPAQEVSGDYFDVIPLSETKIGICIADVAGKGVAAALLMANVQAAVRAFAGESVRPAEVCERLNSVLCSNLAAGKFVTFLYGAVDVPAKTFVFSNAGHWFPLLAHADGQVETRRESGLVLGISADANYQDQLISIQEGDRILLFTDGITEATNGTGTEFGEARLREKFAKLSSDGAEPLLGLLEEVSNFCEGKFADDATLVMIQFKRESSQAAGTPSGSRLART
jgi:phosphoserine phosphatase RsbU/P